MEGSSEFISGRFKLFNPNKLLFHLEFEKWVSVQTVNLFDDEETLQQAFSDVGIKIEACKVTLGEDFVIIDLKSVNPALSKTNIFLVEQGEARNFRKPPISGKILIVSAPHIQYSENEVFWAIHLQDEDGSVILVLMKGKEAFKYRLLLSVGFQIDIFGAKKCSIGSNPGYICEENFSVKVGDRGEVNPLKIGLTGRNVEGDSCEENINFSAVLGILQEDSIYFNLVEGTICLLYLHLWGQYVSDALPSMFFKGTSIAVFNPYCIETNTEKSISLVVAGARSHVQFCSTGNLDTFKYWLLILPSNITF